MATIRIKGSVDNLIVGEAHGLASISDAQGNMVNLFVWSDAMSDYSPTQRLVHGNWMAMLREALIHNKRIEAAFDPERGYAIIELALGALPPPTTIDWSKVVSVYVKEFFS